MKHWAGFLQDIFFRMERPSIEEIQLEDDHPQVVKAQVAWQAKGVARLAATRYVLDTCGLSWPKCFQSPSLTTV